MSGLPDIDSLIIQNAKRLLDDAVMLFENDRHASAFALAVLSLEETGKFLLREWQRSDSRFGADLKRHGFHKVKQAVVGSLYLSKAACEANALFHDNGDDVTDEQVAHVARAMYEAKERDFLKYAFDGVIDKTKQCAFYLDEWGLSQNVTPFDFSRTDSDRAIEQARYALSLVGDGLSSHVAKAIYRAHLDNLPKTA